MVSWYNYNQRGILWGQNAEDSPAQGTDWGGGCCPTVGWNRAAGKNNWENRFSHCPCLSEGCTQQREVPFLPQVTEAVWGELRREKLHVLPRLPSPTHCRSSRAVCNHLGGCSVSAWLDFKALLKLFGQFSSDLERSSQMCWQLCSWCISIQDTKPLHIGKVIQSVRTCMGKYKYFIRTSGQIILRVLIPHFGLLKTCC